MIDSMEFMTPREAKAAIIEVLTAGLVPFVRSSPGCGKSSIFRQIGDEFGLHVIDHRLSTSAAEDLSGLPRFNDNGKAYFAPFEELFPVEDTPLPKGKEGFLIFLDEFNSAEQAVQSAAFKLVLDKMTGQHRLHEKTGIGCAGNHDTDRAITNPISTAMQSRVVHISMKEDFNQWLLDVAIPGSYDSRIIAYLNHNPGKLMNFRPDHNDKTFCSPRTWSFLNSLVQGKEVTPEKIKLYGGTITSGVAAEFVTFCAVFKDLINWTTVAGDPEGTPVPSNDELRWATISHLVEHADEKNIGPLTTYANRFALKFRILYFRMLNAQKPKVRSYPEFRAGCIELSKYLND